MAYHDFSHILCAPSWVACPPFLVHGSSDARSCSTPPGFARESSGAAGVEFAIVLPLFLFITFGAAYLGLYIGLSHSLQAMSADASRYAMVGRDATERRALVKAAITDSAPDYALIDPDLVTFDVEERDRWLKVSVSYDVTQSDLPAIVSRPLGHIDSLQRSATVLLP